MRGRFPGDDGQPFVYSHAPCLASENGNKADPAARPGWFWLVGGDRQAKPIVTCSRGMRSGPRKGRRGRALARRRGGGIRGQRRRQQEVESLLYCIHAGYKLETDSAKQTSSLLAVCGAIGAGRWNSERLLAPCDGRQAPNNEDQSVWALLAVRRACRDGCAGCRAVALIDSPVFFPVPAPVRVPEPTRRATKGCCCWPSFAPLRRDQVVRDGRGLWIVSCRRALAAYATR